METRMLSKFKDDYEELNYCGLDFQSSVYSLTVLNFKSGDKKLLAAPLRGNVLCIDMQHNVPIIKPVPLASTPVDFDLVSIDSMNQSARRGKIFIGVTFTKSSESIFLIYTMGGRVDDNDDDDDGNDDDGAGFNLERLICYSKLLIEFVPLQLYHSEVWNDKSGCSLKTVFLLSGMDGKVHVFEEVQPPEGKITYKESDASIYFPEFSTFTGIVTSMQCVNLATKRLTSVGLRDGRSYAFVVDLAENSILKSYAHDHDDVITSLSIFTLYPSDPNVEPDVSEYNLLITSAFEQSTIYRGVFKLGFCQVNPLADSNSYDCCLCGIAADVDLDGVVEVVLGTYGQRLLFYKLLPAEAIKLPPSSSSSSAASAVTSAAAKRQQISAVTAGDNINFNNSGNKLRSRSAAMLTGLAASSSSASPAIPITPARLHKATTLTAAALSSTATLKSMTSSSTSSTAATSSTIVPLGSLSSTFCAAYQETRITTTTTNITTTTANITTADTATAITTAASNLNTTNGGGDGINNNNSNNNTDDILDSDNVSINSYNFSSAQLLEQLSFQLVDMRDLNEPIMALRFLDLTSDSLKELVVMTLKGVHIMQKNLSNVLMMMRERLNVQS